MLSVAPSHTFRSESQILFRPQQLLDPQKVAVSRLESLERFVGSPSVKPLQAPFKKDSLSIWRSQVCIQMTV